jgi:RecB family exonuclease
MIVEKPRAVAWKAADSMVEKERAVGGKAGLEKERAVEWKAGHSRVEKKSRAVDWEAADSTVKKVYIAGLRETRCAAAKKMASLAAKAVLARVEQKADGPASLRHPQPPLYHRHHQRPPPLQHQLSTLENPGVSVLAHWARVC